MRTGWLVVAMAALANGGCGGKKDEPSDQDKAAAAAAASSYAAKSKATEATIGIRKIYDGARSYYMEEHGVDANQALLPRQFPASAPLTPPLGECCKAGGKCAVAAAQWETPAWKALYFDVLDPHYYSYEFVSSGTGEAAVFTARAVGDLDCDGTYSTFEIIGHIEQDGEISGATGMFKNRELE